MNFNKMFSYEDCSGEIESAILDTFLVKRGLEKLDDHQPGCVVEKVLSRRTKTEEIMWPDAKL
jgi:hypothetical protein